VPLIQLEAAKALLAQGKAHERALAKIADHLDSDDKLLGPALEAARSLGSAGRPLFPAIKKLALKAMDFQVQRQCLDALRSLRGDGKELVHVWVKLAQDNPAFLTFPPEDEVRANPKEVQTALSDLVKHLGNQDVNVRARVMEFLAILGPAAKEAMPALIKTLDDDDFPASQAVAALGAMGPEAKPAVKALVKHYEDVKAREANGKAPEGDYRRRKILEAMEKIGPGAVDAIPLLLKYLPEQPQAARVLGKIGPLAKEAVPALEKMYREGKIYDKTAAAFALLKITEKQEPYLAELTETLRKSKSPDIRLHTIEMLSDLGVDARPALPVLLAIVKEKSKQQEGPFGRAALREPAAAALAAFGPDAKDAVPDLIDMIQNSYYRAKITAANTLAAIGPAAKAAIPALEKMALEDEHYEAVVQNALAKIRGKS
jgi:HEAT repeat protein